MNICPSCGTEYEGDAKECPACEGAGHSADPEAIETFHVYITSKKSDLGPFDSDTVRKMIQKGQVSHADFVRRRNESSWTPLLESDFSKEMIERVNTQRLASTTCPRCGGTLVAKAKYPVGALILVASGIVLTPCFFVGIPLWIVGWIWMIKSKGTHFVCPKCKYSAD